MKLITFTESSRTRIGLLQGEQVVDLSQVAPTLPDDMLTLLQSGATAMTEAAKRFKRGELPGVEGLHKRIGGQERSIWKDQIGHLGPGFDRLEGYVFYATLYGKSPELISEPIKFSSWNSNPSFLSDELDKIFREIAWKAVVGHPLSGVTDKNRNGIGDDLE